MKLIRRFIPAGGHVLDAGSGEGSWVAFLREDGFAAVGLDYSQPMVDEARRRYSIGEFVQGDIRRQETRPTVATELSLGV